MIFHPKGSIDPGIVLTFRPYLQHGYDLVIASRIVPGSSQRRGRPTAAAAQVVRARGMALIAALLWKREGPIIWDVLHGCRGMKRDAFQLIEPLPQGVSIDLEMVVRSYRCGLRQVEFPVAEKPRLSGVNSLSGMADRESVAALGLWRERVRSQPTASHPKHLKVRTP